MEQPEPRHGLAHLRAVNGALKSLGYPMTMKKLKDLPHDPDALAACLAPTDPRQRARIIERIAAWREAAELG